MKNIIIWFFVLCCVNAFAQHRNNTWCFGDSAGIDFSNLNNPIPIHTAVKSRGSCVSICDTNSNLLFYAYTRAGLAGNTSLVKNKLDSVMPNGDNIIGSGWYMELIIIPFPDDTFKYYLFTAGETNVNGFFYSIIDMMADNGLGDVIQKNTQLLPNASNDGLTAIKHGNGRDWWLIQREYSGSNNIFNKFLITTTGISGPFTQSIGSFTNTNTCRYIFNKAGNKLAMVMYDGIIETFDFDRCTGILSNHVLIRPKNTSPPTPAIWSSAFSPDSRYLYVSSHGNPPLSCLIQIDLQDSAPWANADTIWRDSVYAYSAGALKLAPDNKIYLTSTWYDGMSFNFPYPDTLHNNVIDNLSVINSPDSPGTACNFTPYSFYLGGNRTYLGLPNNPDYDMPRLQGSPCDTVQWTGVQEIEQPKGDMFVSYISDWQKAFINAQHLKGTTYTLSVIDITGRQVFKENGRLHPPYYTKDLDCDGFAKGMYIITLQTEKERLVKKFVKN